MRVYRKFSFKVQESYSLDYISEDVLGQKKLDYRDLGYRSLDDLYESGYETFIDYNIRDCELIELLENKLGMFGHIFTMAYIAKVNFSDMLARFARGMVLLMTFLCRRNMSFLRWKRNQIKHLREGLSRK